MMPVCKQKLCLWMLLPVVSGCVHTGREAPQDAGGALSAAEIETFDIEGYLEETAAGLGFPFTPSGADGGLRADTPIRRSRDEGR